MDATATLLAVVIFGLTGGLLVIGALTLATLVLVLAEMLGRAVCGKPSRRRA